MKKQLFISAKNVEYVTGMSRRYSYDCMSKMRKLYGKTKYQKVTVREFCDFIGADEEEIRARLP